MKKDIGYVHIYCGDGKGKTTTGMGLCVRAAGYGYRVLLYQFMKNNKTSERSVLKEVPNITLMEDLRAGNIQFSDVRGRKSGTDTLL